MLRNQTRTHGTIEDLNEIASGLRWGFLFVSTLITDVIEWLDSPPPAVQPEAPLVPPEQTTQLERQLEHLKTFANQRLIHEFTAVLEAIINHNRLFNPSEYIELLLTNITYGDTTTIVELNTISGIIAEKDVCIDDALKKDMKQKIEFLILNLTAKEIAILENANLIAIEIVTSIRARKDALEMEAFVAQTYDCVTPAEMREVAGKVQTDNEQGV